MTWSDRKYKCFIIVLRSDLLYYSPASCLMIVLLLMMCLKWKILHQTTWINYWLISTFNFSWISNFKHTTVCTCMHLWKVSRHFKWTIKLLQHWESGFFCLNSFLATKTFKNCFFSQKNWTAVLVSKFASSAYQLYMN